jgi:mono/diheme cytochrome c family protein
VRLLSINRRRLALKARTAGLAAMLAVTATACRQDMHDAPKLEPLEKSEFFQDGRASRQLLANTIARGKLKEDKLLFAGRDGDAISETFPFPVTEGVVARGRERFNIYCSPCHAQTGEGNGMIVQRGYKQPPSFHEERLRVMPAGYFFQVMTNGYLTMPSYSLQVSPEDRWAIAAYVKALQLSRNVSASELSADERAKVDSGASEAKPADSHGGHGGGHGNDGDGHGEEGHGKEAHGG